MTPEERLAIAEDALRSCGTIQLHDVKAGWDAENGEWRASHAWDEWCVKPVATHQSAVECIVLARQEFAAEKEAAMTPNERKYKKALEEIAGKSRYHGSSCTCNESYSIAIAALEESP